MLLLQIKPFHIISQYTHDIFKIIKIQMQEFLRFLLFAHTSQQDILSIGNGLTPG